MILHVTKGMYEFAGVERKVWEGPSRLGRRENPFSGACDRGKGVLSGERLLITT
jgi:hypothetical protein